MLISTKIETLGLCLYDTYRADGDLHVTTDIVQQSEDGTFPRPADARYGVDQPEGEAVNSPPVQVVVKIEYHDHNGHGETTKTVLGNGHLISHRPI